MANKWNKIEGNLAGSFYIDENCINCGLCASICPDVYASKPSLAVHIVQKQPTSEKEIELATEAQECCPADAIGNDG